jgi:hypothetical protein
MVLPWTATVAMPRAVELAASLEAGSAARAGAVAAVAKRLERELARAGDETKLYKKQGERSELALYARAVSGVEARADFEAAIDRPLRARADARGTPRRIRKAIREALGE